MKKKLFVLLIGMVMSTTATTVALADEGKTLSCPDKPKAAAEVRNMAGTFFGDAETSFDNGDYLKALEKFLCSMMMIEHANTVINIEKTLSKLPDDMAAVPLLRDYAKQVPDGELTEKIGSLADGIEKSRVAEDASMCDCANTSSAAECPPPVECPDTSPGLDRAHRLLFLTGWVDVSVGAAAFVSAIVLQGIAGAQKNRAKNATNYDAFLEAKDKNKSFQIAATSMFIASALVAGTGLVHLLLLSEEQKKLKTEAGGGTKDSAPKDDKEKRAKPTVTFMPGPTWLGIEGTF